MTKRLANLAAWAHFSWVLLGIVSLPLLFIIGWWNKVVLIFAVVNILDWKFARTCTLLQLELDLRKRDNPSGSFEGRGFMEHYLKKLFNFDISRSSIILGQRIYLGVLIFIAVIQIFWTR